MPRAKRFSCCSPPATKNARAGFLWAREWEGDLLTGANDTHIATLVERNTRFTMLVRIPRKDTTTVVAMLAKHIRKLPKELRRSLTWDQGKEMHAHKRFTVATNVQVYFC